MPRAGEKQAGKRGSQPGGGSIQCLINIGNDNFTDRSRAAGLAGTTTIGRTAPDSELITRDGGSSLLLVKDAGKGPGLHLY